MTVPTGESELNQTCQEYTLILPFFLVGKECCPCYSSRNSFIMALQHTLWKGRGQIYSTPFRHSQMRKENWLINLSSKRNSSLLRIMGFGEMLKSVLSWPRTAASCMWYPQLQRQEKAESRSSSFFTCFICVCCLHLDR
jgi:hypothetical protein